VLDRILAAGPPLEFSQWTLDPAALESLLGWVAAGRESVLECGSGLSTVLIARALRERGAGRVSALEHDPRVAVEVRAAIEREDLGAWAAVIEAPLGPNPLAQPGCEWYAQAAVEQAPPEVDLLLVDGPPAWEAGLERSRYPALPALAGRLAPGALVVLDDATRAGEAWVLERWEREHGIRFELRPGERIAVGCMFSPREARGAIETGEGVMRGTRLWLVGLMVVLASALFAAGCGDDEEESGDGTTASGEDLGLISEGTLTVGTDTPFEPFEIGQPPNISGYDIDVMNAIAEELGLEAEYTDTGFGTIFRDTANGQFDTAAAASTITKGRENAVDFTDPYYEAQQALLVPEDSDIASVDDLSADVIVGAQDGTTGETYANEETEAGDVRGFPEGPNAISALVTGQVDAVIIDQPVAALAIEKQGGFEIIEEIQTDELYGFAVAPDNDALREAMNEALATIKEDGTIEELYAEYFAGAAPPESVLTGTNELLTDD